MNKNKIGERRSRGGKREMRGEGIIKKNQAEVYT